MAITRRELEELTMANMSSAYNSLMREVDQQLSTEYLKSLGLAMEKVFRPSSHNFIKDARFFVSEDSATSGFTEPMRLRPPIRDEKVIRSIDILYPVTE
jgi:hypothetical protein